MKFTDKPGVLHVVDSLDFGGTQTILKNLFEAQPDNTRMVLLALRETDRQVRIAHPNVHVYPSPSRFSLLPIRYLLKLAREQQIRILHCHLFRSQVLGYLAAQVLKDPPVTLVFHEHGSANAVESGSRIEGFAFRRFQSLAALRVDLNISISRFVEEALRSLTHGRARRSVVLYNPIPTMGHSDRLQPEHVARLRETLGVPQGRFLIGMASRIVHRKGWRLFLDAVGLLAEEVPLHFLVAGDGPEFAMLKAEITSRKLDQHGRALGYVDNPPDFYGALDCFVMPSFYEPAGLSHLEAQSFSLPVVACNIPGLNETVVDGVNCLLCRPKDAQDMADKITLLATDRDLRARIARAGRDNAVRYSIRNYIRELETQYSAAMRSQ